MATFLGVRSLTTNDTNVWQCNCRTNGNQDVCSETVSTALGNTDRIVPCTSGTFAGIGDNFATTSSHCTRVTTGNGCATCYGTSCQDCPDTFAPFNECDNWGTNWGFRNEHNIVRFLWDVIDTSTDSGQDDTDESMASLASILYSNTLLPCTSETGYDEDGNCNESNRDTPAECEPASLIGDAIQPHMGTRDSVNVWDLGDIVAGSQAAERAINCVEGAGD